MRIVEATDIGRIESKRRVLASFESSKSARDFKIATWEISEYVIGVRARGIKNGTVRFTDTCVVVELRLKGWAKRMFGAKIKETLSNVLQIALE